MEIDHFVQNPWVILISNATPALEDDCACPDYSGVFYVGQAEDSENDCACANHLNCQALECKPDARYVKSPEILDIDLPRDFHLAFSPYSLQGPSALNRAAWERLQAFSEPQGLAGELDQQLAGQHLIAPVDSHPRIIAGQPRTFTAWLHVTNACNLECPYCYVRKSSAQMSEATGLRALKQVFHTAQNNGFRAVKLKYAGGEATLHFGLVKKLHQHASQFAAERGMALEEVVLSNGSHLRTEDAQWLIENNIRLMISLDGIGAVHDRSRPWKNGKRSSFAAAVHVIENILIPLGCYPFISITITRLNVGGVADTVRWALGRNLPVSLNFYRQHPSADAVNDLAADPESIIAGMRAAYAVVEEILPDRPFLNGLLDRVQIGAHTQTCGVGTAYAVIAHDGRVAQCQMQMEQGRPVLGDSVDLLSITQSGLIQNPNVMHKSECAACHFRFLCTGGCPLETYQKSGRWDARSPNCAIYKNLLPELLRLEGLRLLKVNGYLN